MAGIYVLGPDLVNGKSHWLQDPGSNAIWYDKRFENWKIGSNLGSSSASIISYDDVAGPQVATTWKYYNKKWIAFLPSDDIFVDTFVEPGTYK